MSKLAEAEARHIAVVYRCMLKHLDRELTPHGLGPGRYAYLFSLYIQDGRTQQALADAVAADKAAAARALLRLEHDGYIKRIRDPVDRRQTRAFLTDKGRELRPMLEHAAHECVAAISEPLSPLERKEFKRLLAKIATPLIAR